MRIAILTYHAVCNFGANLQALASTRALQARGHEVLLLHYLPKQVSHRYRETTPAAQYEAHEHFVSTFLPISAPCTNEPEVAELAKDFKPDVVAVGSDAVFNLHVGKTSEETQLFPNPFFLEWATDLGCKKVSLSASSQGTFFPRLDRQTRSGIRRAWKSFELISCRDRWTQRMIGLMTSLKCWPIRTPDPVTNLPQVFSLDNAEAEQKSLSGQYYLIMPRMSGPNTRLEPSWVKEFVSLAHQRDKQVFALPTPQYEGDWPVDRILPHPMSPLEWYAWIKHAFGYMGTLFHPIVSSISTGTPFLSLDQYADHRIPWRSKVYDMLIDAKMTGAQVPEKKLQTLSPEQAIAKLDNRDLQDRSTLYKENAIKRFNNLLDQITSNS